MATKNPKQNTYVDDFRDEFLDSFEKLEHQGEKVTHTLSDAAKELSKATIEGAQLSFQEMMKQAFGNAYGGKHNESIHSAEHKKPAKIEAGIDYVGDILRGTEQLRKRETHELHEQISQILSELKQLAKSSKELQAQFKEVAVEVAPVDPGKYHESFFQWMLITIRTIRQRVDDSGAWLSMMSSKKGKKDYWSMFKKHGTMFGMSGERSISNQVA